MSPIVSRTLTIIAAGVLAFDGAALAALGWWSGRLMLILLGAAFFVSSGLVLLYWRWYKRKLEDIGTARRALAEEAREMRRVIRER